MGQITINCGERGLLLLRVRDDIRMTIAAYQTLYESSIAFGMRKALMAEQRKRNMEARIRELEQQCDECEKQVHSLQDKIKSTEQYEETKRAEDRISTGNRWSITKNPTKNLNEISRVCYLCPQK